MSSFRLAVVSAILISAIACGSSSSPTPTTPSPTPAPAPAAAPPPTATSTSVTIPVGAQTLGNRAFNPDEADVTIGSTVEWTNTDSVSHTSTSNVAGWDSGIVAPGGKFSFTFQTAGTFQYHCAIHPGMVGTVVVR